MVVRFLGSPRVTDVPALVIAFPGPVERSRDGLLYLPDKLTTGLAAYAARWPGDVILAVHTQNERPVRSLGGRWLAPSDLPVAVVTGRSLDSAVGAARPDLLLASLVPGIEALGDHFSRTVLVSEFHPTDLTRADLRPVRGPWPRARIRAGGLRRARRLRHVVRSTRGVQCNGLPAYHAFRDASPDAIVIFDTRLTMAHLNAALTSTPRHRSVARLCFSGRLVEVKGPAYAIEVARNLERLGVPVELLVFGAGALEDALRTGAPPSVTFEGVVDFATTWTRRVREEVDLLVLPHVQGDPSGTYLEGMGCGVPVVGFDNMALASLAPLTGAARTVSVGDVDALTEAVGSTLADPGWRAVARESGLAFMSEHHIDVEFDRRVDHLVRVHARRRP